VTNLLNSHDEIVKPCNCSIFWALTRFWGAYLLLKSSIVAEWYSSGHDRISWQCLLTTLQHSASVQSRLCSKLDGISALVYVLTKVHSALPSNERDLDCYYSSSIEETTSKSSVFWIVA